MRDTQSASIGLARRYASDLRAYAKTQMASMDAANLLLSFDGARTPASAAGSQTSAKELASALRSLNASDPHPVIKLLDGMFAYLLRYRDPILTHTAQRNCEKLYKAIYQILEAANSEAPVDLVARAKRINEIRAAAFEAVRTRDHGEFYDLVWTFLWRTSNRDERASFANLPLEDIYPYREDVGEEHNSAEAFKPIFTKTIAAAELAQAENPWALQLLFIWISNALAVLFNGLHNDQLEAMVEDASAATAPPPAVPGLTIRTDAPVVEARRAVQSTLHRLRQPGSPSSRASLFGSRGSASDAGSVGRGSDLASVDSHASSPRSITSEGSDRAGDLAASVADTASAVMRP